MTWRWWRSGPPSRPRQPRIGGQRLGPTMRSTRVRSRVPPARVASSLERAHTTSPPPCRKRCGPRTLPGGAGSMARTRSLRGPSRRAARACRRGHARVAPGRLPHSAGERGAEDAFARAPWWPRRRRATEILLTEAERASLVDLVCRALHLGGRAAATMVPPSRSGSRSVPAAAAPLVDTRLHGAAHGHGASCRAGARCAHQTRRTAPSTTAVAPEAPKPTTSSPRPQLAASGRLEERASGPEAVNPAHDGDVDVERTVQDRRTARVPAVHQRTGRRSRGVGALPIGVISDRSGSGDRPGGGAPLGLHARQLREHVVEHGDHEVDLGLAANEGRRELDHRVARSSARQIRPASKSAPRVAPQQPFALLVVERLAVSLSRTISMP